MAAAPLREPQSLFHFVYGIETIVVSKQEATVGIALLPWLLKSITKTLP